MNCVLIFNFGFYNFLDATEHLTFVNNSVVLGKDYCPNTNKEVTFQAGRLGTERCSKLPIRQAFYDVISGFCIN